jgi:hypothetical protein
MYFAAGIVGCKATADSVKLLEGDFTAPELQDFAPRDNTTITLRFSKPVTVSAAEVWEAETESLLGEATRVSEEDLAEVTLQLLSPTELGLRYWLNGIVTDDSGNSLDFSVSFTGYNDKVPTLLLSEVRSKNDTNTSGKPPKPKMEYVELYCLNAGNLAGVQLFNAADGMEKTFEFPACEIERGEYIVVHFGKTTEITETEADELEDNLAFSVGINATEGRDFYVIDDGRRISETDILLLRERAGGKVMDVLLTNGNAKTVWDPKFLPAVTEAAESGLWPNAEDIATALDSAKVTATRTLGRQNNAEALALIEAGDSVEKLTLQGRDAWLLTTTSAASPGKPNSDVPFVEKSKVASTKSIAAKKK